MKSIHALLKTLRSEHNRPFYQQLELPLSGRKLTRGEQRTIVQLRRLRERLAMA